MGLPCSLLFSVLCITHLLCKWQNRTTQCCRNLSGRYAFHYHAVSLYLVHDRVGLDYINGKDITASDLYPIKKFVQHLKFQKILDRYDEFYSLDMFGESTEGHKHMNPYVPFGKGKVIVNMNFDDEDE